MQAVQSGHATELNEFLSELGIAVIAHKIVQWTSSGKIHKKDVIHEIQTEVETNKELQVAFDKLIITLGGQLILRSLFKIT